MVSEATRAAEALPPLPAAISETEEEMKKRKYTKSAKWHERYRTQVNPSKSATGEHEWSVRVVQSGSDEDLKDRTERAEDAMRVANMKYAALKELLLDIYGRKS